MESIQELLRKLCKCIVKSDDGLNYITINKQETPTPPTPPEPEKPDLDTFDPNVPFCIENVGDKPVFLCAYNYFNNYYTRSYCEISYDNKTWKPYELKNSRNSPPTDMSEINIIALNNKGDRVYFKMDDYVYTSTNYYNYTHFYFLNDNQGIKVRARGNIASLNYGRDDLYKTKYLEIDDAHKYCFQSMFLKCISLVQAPDLPATTLADGCYQSMFTGCTSLTQAPELPATTLAYACYNNMFNSCTSLTQAPELPATTLANNCYNNMFYRCTKLNYVKCLATDISAANCTANWLNNVSSTGDFYTPTTTNWKSGIDGIPRGWTRHDIT